MFVAQMMVVFINPASPRVHTCQAPRAAEFRSTGSTLLTTRLTAKAGPPRTTSSANRAEAQSSAPNDCPMRRLTCSK